MIGCLVLTALLVLAACGGGSEPETREFDLEIVDGTLTLDPPVLKVKQNDEVVLRIDSDEEVELHLHGYDLTVAAGPDELGELSFVANATGPFPIALHSLSSHDEEDHSHDPTEPECVATLPAGAEPPTIHLTASEAEESGELNVAVEISNFLLSSKASGAEISEGHWHLFIDGRLIGMYTTPEVTVAVAEAGKHELLVTLSDIEHCDYPFRDSITVTIESGAEEEHEHDDADEEEVIVGTLEVQPR